MALTGCGGSGSDDTDTSPAPDPDRAAERRFVSELDAHCERADALSARSRARFKQVQAEASSSAEAARGIARVIAGLEPRVAALERELRALDVPESERRFADRYVALTGEINNLVAASSVAAEKGDIAAFQGLTERSQVAAAARDRLVESHGGFEHCGS